MAKKQASQLLAKKPTKSAKRLKCMLFGESGVGKTTAAVQFPRPYVIDTERGMEQDEYVDLLDARGGVVMTTTSFDTVLQQVRALALEEHEFMTLVIDPITVLYDGLADSWEKRVGNEFHKHHAAARRDWKRLTALLTTLDMNVIWTSHAKNEWLNSEMTGRTTFDGPKGADYWIDLMLSINRDRETGKRTATIRKSRIKTLPVDDTFEFSYDAIAERYGRDVLERSAVAIDPRVLELGDLLAAREDGDDIEAKILKAKGVGSIKELSPTDIGKAIEWLQTI